MLYLSGTLLIGNGNRNSRQHNGAASHIQIQRHAKFDQHLPDEPECRRPDGSSGVHADSASRGPFQT